MQNQSEKLKKTNRNLKKIEHSAIPGLDRMLGLIKNVETRNKIVIAFVIALCVSFVIYFHFLSPFLASGVVGSSVSSNITESSS